MASPDDEEVYATLLLTDSYLPGVLVLAHSLRDAATTKKLAVLVTLDSVSAEVVSQLEAVFDYVLPVSRIRNERPANLYLMDRRDLHSAFTKINLWKQTQFRKIVYVDADVVAYRAPDELFDRPAAFSAAPDIGWPDLFNTGVMVLTPNTGDYYALMAMAERGISFDGADQGLLNMHFGNNYDRLSFAYNVTPSAHYQYVPAYRHFQSTINLVHFIGPNKPWAQGRDAHTGSGPFNEMVGRWWAVYDRHYRRGETSGGPPPQDGRTYQSALAPPAPELVQYFVKGEYQPGTASAVFFSAPHSGQLVAQDVSKHLLSLPPPPPSLEQHTQEPQHSVSGAQQQQQDLHEPSLDEKPQHLTSSPPPPPAWSDVENKARAPSPPQTTQSYWDAQSQPPPPDSKPEAVNLPQTHYPMSSDTTPYVPPQRYPSPPRDMWYKVPTRQPSPPPSRKPDPIFPWEAYQPHPSRVFAANNPPPFQPEAEPTSEPIHSEADDPTGDPETTEPPAQELTHPEREDDTGTPPATGANTSQSAPWSSFPRTNAWDDVPQIERYIESLQPRRQRKNPGLRLPGGLPPFRFGSQGRETVDDPEIPLRRGSRVTDFPSAAERPSLPVTPAPIGRRNPWNNSSDAGDDLEAGEKRSRRRHSRGGDDGDDDDSQTLPSASGVPAQSDWDPASQLRKLAKHQADLVLRELGSTDAGRSFLARGSPPTTSTTYSDSPEGDSTPPVSREVDGPPAYAARFGTLVSPQPLKPGSAADKVGGLLRSEESGDVPDSFTSETVQEPSYRGPGLAFEKGEDVPAYESPVLPTDEELGVLET